MTNLTFDQWLDYGITRSFCGPPSCDTHETVMNESEADDYFAGADACIWVTRLLHFDRTRVTG